ncbi:MAG: thiamine pyrophosphate-requiring protein [Alphaproteobacteria bacterium]
MTTVAEALLTRLRARGVDYLFANGGTDFAPVIEALARAGAEAPEALAISHETAAVAMAHGYYLVTGRPQAVMVHVNVGLANATMGLINAATDNVPIVMCSGRTPVTERGHPGSRNLPIHWGQEMRDQGAMVREFVKWDYELRSGSEVETLVDRALAIAMSEPRGPVYLSLPREVLGETHVEALASADPVMVASAPGQPDPVAIAQAAEFLAGAERPLIIAQRGDPRAADFEPLASFAEDWAVPVVEFWPVRNALASNHAMHAGYQVEPWLSEADVVLVLDALVPWVPDQHAPPAGCKVIQAGPDPLFTRTPLRGFPADLALAGKTATVVSALAEALRPRLAENRAELAVRRARVATSAAEARQARLAEARQGNGAPMSPQWASHCLSEALGPEAALFTELGCDPSVMSFERPGGYFSHALSGGLGWALPAALGAQLADRERLVAACIGEGSHIFANPVSCHQIAEAQELPILTVVFNNGVWNSVRRATLAMYPDGQASRMNLMPVTSLAPAPDFVGIVEASRGWGERVERGEDLPGALARAIEVIRGERRQALLDVAVAAA